MRKLLIIAILISGFAQSFGQQRGTDVSVKSGESETTQVARMNGNVIEIGHPMYDSRFSWGKTAQDAEAAEQALIRQANGHLVDHSNRLDGRSYNVPVGKIREDEIGRRNRRWVVRMVHQIHAGKEEWSIGYVDAKEILLGTRVGHQQWLTLKSNGTVQLDTIDVFTIGHCRRCFNPTEGMIYVRRSNWESPITITERTTDTGKVVWAEESCKHVPSQCNVTNIMIAPGQGPGPIMSPMSIYMTAPMAPFYIFRRRGCPPQLVCPGGPPALPDVPGGPPIGSPPNNDENRPPTIGRGG